MEKKMIGILVCMLMLGASIIPVISGTNQKINNLETDDKEMLTPLPRWREGGTPHDSEQSLTPYVIKLRDSPTSGLIESPTEYGPIRGILFCYKGGEWNSVVTDLVVALTKDDDFDEIAYVLVTSESQKNSAINDFTNGGANLDKVEFIIEPANAIWIRDYGPHFIFQDGAIGIVDSHYYPTRPLDNFIPTLIGDDHFIMPTYDIGLYYSGGNFLPSRDRTAFMSSLVNLDNPSIQGFDEELIAELFQTYQGIDELHIMPKLPNSVDGTGHIDMWMYFIDDDTVIISEFKPGSDATAIEITNNAVPYMQNLGYTVYRTPAWNAPHPQNGYNTHWTYTNSFIANGRIFIPTYGSTYPDYADEDAQALAVFQAAAPDLEIVQINCFPIIWAAGAMHCIVMQVPRYIDPKPSVNVIWPDGGEFFTSGTNQTIQWASSDSNNDEIPQIDLYYSIDGGNNYIFIDTTTDTGFYNWTVPNVETNQALIKVIAKSSDSDEGVGISSEFFNISYAVQSVYNFVTGAGVNKYCYGHQTRTWNDIDGVLYPVINEIGSSDYPKIAYSDATGNNNDPNRYRSVTPSSSNESTYIYEFYIDEEPDNIDDVEILWEGYSDSCSQAELYVWDNTEGQWGDGEGLFNQNRYMDNWAGNRDGYLNKNIRSDFDRYISPSGQITFLLYTERAQYRSFHDYISIIVSVIPPSAPSTTGTASGKTGTSYDYVFNSVDPDDDQVKYIIDWGDGKTDTTNLNPSGADVTVKHAWSKDGSYIIKVHAQDENGFDGPESTMTVTMPRNRAITWNFIFMKILEHFPLLERILNLQ